MESVGLNVDAVNTHREKPEVCCRNKSTYSSISTLYSVLCIQCSRGGRHMLSVPSPIMGVRGLMYKKEGGLGLTFP